MALVVFGIFGGLGFFQRFCAFEGGMPPCEMKSFVEK
jgi:hypothetical protein